MTTYTRTIIQLVFATKNRSKLPSQELANRFGEYICGIIRKEGVHVYAFKCMPDHVHLLMDLKTTTSIADFVRTVKSSSSKWMNDVVKPNIPFQWQTGYGVFSYHRDQTQILVNYIRNQEIHHKKRSFREEYLGMLAEHDVTFDPKYFMHE